MQQFRCLLSRAILVFAAIGIGASAFAQTCGTIGNGSFEGTGPQNQNVPTGSNALAPWAVVSDSVDWISAANNVAASHGASFLDLNGPNGGGRISQTVCTEIGRRYRLTFDVNVHPGSGTGNAETLIVSAGNESFEVTLNPNGSLSPAWRRSIAVEFVAFANTTGIEFQSFGFDATGPLLDNVNLTPVELVGCVPTFLFGIGYAPAAGLDSVVSFDLNPACTWTTNTNVPWITFPFGSSGTGPTALSFDVAPNTSPNPRTGALFINNRRFLITQAGTTCTYSISPGSKNATASADLGIFGVAAPAGCKWTAISDSDWIQLTEFEQEGSGFVFFTILGNTTAQRRTGTIFVAGQLFTVTQAAANHQYNCTTEGNTFDFDAVRTEALTESLEDLQILCSGTPPAGGATGDILVTYNATITSRLTGPAADDIDVWLILNDATNPTPGVTAFRGKLAGPTAVKFQNVPLTNVVNGHATFRIVNVRVNANSLPPFQSFFPVVAAVVQIRSTRFIPIAGNYTFLGLPGQSFTTTVSAAAPVGTTHQMLPVAFTESDTAHFRPKEKPAGSTVEFRSEAESLFKHPNLGAQTGQADTGTRLRLRIPVAAGVRVWAPTTLLGNVDARLMSSDETGLGGSVVTGSALFGGMYQELTPVNGFATAVWEVFAAEAELRESATAQLVFQGGNMTTITRGVVSSFGPTSTIGTPNATAPVPRFLDPLAAPRVVNLRVTPSIQALSTSASGKIAVREVVGSNFRFSYEVANDGTDQATNVVVRGNLLLGLNYTSCTRTDGGACAVSGGEARATIDSLNGGQTVTVNVNATQSTDIPEGTVLENTVSASSDQIDADLQSNQATTPFLLDTCNVTLSATSISIGGAGGAGTFSFTDCPYWVVRPDVPWITITSVQSGTGAGSVSFTVAQNPTTSPRSGAIVAAGRIYTVNQAGGDGMHLTVHRHFRAERRRGSQVKRSAQRDRNELFVERVITRPGCRSSPQRDCDHERRIQHLPELLRRPPRHDAEHCRPLVHVQQAAGLTDINERIVQLAYFNFLGRLPSANELAGQKAVLASKSVAISS